MSEFNLKLFNKSAFDVLAHVLQLKKHTSYSNIYFDKNKTLYRRTRWGFEKCERYNLQLELSRKQRQYEQLQAKYYDLYDEYEHVMKRKSGLNQHLESLNQLLKQGRKEKGFLKKHLKEVLDKNISIDKRMDRMLKQEANLMQQIEKLKKTKDNLLEHNLLLTDKNRQQKNQIKALQLTIEQLKQTSKQEQVEKFF